MKRTARELKKRRQYAKARQLATLANDDCHTLYYALNGSLKLDFAGFEACDFLPMRNLQDHISRFEPQNASKIIFDGWFGLELDVSKPLKPQVISQMRAFAERLQAAIATLDDFDEERDLARIQNLARDIRTMK